MFSCTALAYNRDMDHFTAKTEQFIREHGLIGAGDTVIAGISGGVDSVCLLQVLDALKDKMHFSLTAVHVHHGIRGASADADLDFVRELCAGRGITCHVHRVDVPALAAQMKMSEEEAGHLVRSLAYISLKEISRSSR